MNLYTAAQIREWDAYTIAHEPIASIDLMERAAGKCVSWLLNRFGPYHRYLVMCGKGNNGGDGLAIARQLHQKGVSAEVYILEFGHMGSPDFQLNLQRLHDFNIPIHFVQHQSVYPQPQKDDIIVDALFGSGLNRPLDGLAAGLVQHVNGTGNQIVAIDVPSGMLLDASSVGHAVIKAHFTLSFQATKAAFLLPENEPFTGEVAVLDIRLHPGFTADAPYRLVQPDLIKRILKPRSRFSHKGSFGHTLLVGGSYGKMGALVLSAKAALRSGAGLVTVYIPRCGYNIMQTSVPEAMSITDTAETEISEAPAGIERFTTIGIGPGMGTAQQTQKALADLLSQVSKPMIVDADGLNCIAKQPHLLQKLPAGSILTPHPKEFERLFGTTTNEFEKIQRTQQKASELGLVIILKGHHTFIAAPEGPGYFNSTGNSGMATGGSGDVLTGILSALLAQEYTPPDAAILGVYLHGLAGDLAAAAFSEEALIAGDIPQFLGAAFRKLNS